VLCVASATPSLFIGRILCIGPKESSSPIFKPFAASNFVRIVFVPLRSGGLAWRKFLKELVEALLANRYPISRGRREHRGVFVAKPAMDVKHPRIT